MNESSPLPKRKGGFDFVGHWRCLALFCSSECINRTAETLNIVDGGMTMLKQGRVIVVTGASAGVGRATAVAFARQGARMGLVARERERLEAAKQEVEAAGGSALVIPADVANANQVEAAAERVEQELGPIDVWVNNAMVSVFSPFEEMTPEEFRRVTEVTYLGYVHGTMSALKRMLRRDRGTIVQVGSVLAYRGIPLQSAYCGAKHAIQGFTESVRAELINKRSRVRITMVQMPALNTPQFSWVKSRMPHTPKPVAPIYQPEVAADAIVWATDHYRREWNVAPSTAIAIQANKLAAWVGDWYLGKTGVKSQQTDRPADPYRMNNLWEAPSGDYGAHGEFDAEARPHSAYLWATKNRGWLALVGAALLGTTTALWTRRS